MTTDENKIAILSEMLDDISLADSWEQLLDLDEIAESIDNNDIALIRQHFQDFLDSIGVEDNGFESYNYIINNISQLTG